MKPRSTLLALSALFLSTHYAFAGGGTARVQVIHNCADLAASTVDVYLNNTLLIDDFAFRTASPFIDAPAGVDFIVGIAPSNSASSADAIYTQTFNLAAGGTYEVIASGIVSGSGYNPSPAFELVAFANAQEAATLPGNTDVLVYHGSTDAPTVDVYESAVLNATAVDNASYGDFAGYLNLPTDDYVLQVRDAAQTTTVATYSAPLATLGLQGAALVVVASGFLDPAQNSGGPAFGLWAALPTGGPLVPLPSLSNPTARVQVIHNCADLAASIVDVYLNDALLIDNFAFRTASPFIAAPATIDFTVGIAPSNSTSSADAIYTQTFNLEAGGTYEVIASGIVSGSGYNPSPTFELVAFANAQEEATLPANTDVLVYHGSTDAPTVDVYESAALNVTAVDNASYGDFAGYLNLPTNDYVLQVRDAAQTTTVATYSAPLATLGLQGAALVVVASGFLDPTQNSGGPAFGLWAALPAGGPLVQLPSLSNPTARVQVIHNCADLAASTVDVYLNDALLIDNFAFRTASPFIAAPATIDFTVGIAPANSTSSDDAIYTQTFNLEAGGTYEVIASGIVSGSGYNPSPAFELVAFANAQEAAALPANTDVLVYHGSTDAPMVDVGETAVLGGATIVDDLSYSEYAGYLQVPTADYVLEVRTSDGTPIISYSAPLQTLGLNGAAIVVVASGFLDPAQNSDGAAFGLWVALPSGGPLVPLDIFTSVADLNGALASVLLYPNPANNSSALVVNATERTRADLVISDVAGRQVKGIRNVQLLPGENRMELPITGLSDGLYHVNLITAAGSATTVLQVLR